jgi:hypothetical protein
MMGVLACSAAILGHGADSLARLELALEVTLAEAAGDG